MLSVKHLTREFISGDTKVTAIDNISFSIPQGSFTSIVGKSGSGKTTLLNLLGALDKPTSGSIVVDDQDVTKLNGSALTRYRGRYIGFVFQNYNLIPNLTALENVMLPLGFMGEKANARKQRAAELLEAVGLNSDQMQRKPGKLSGGQQQRVAIARALANRPSLILADEPTGNLDSETGRMIFKLLHDLTRTEKTTIIVVTHDLSIAGKTDTTYKLQDGKIIK
jgi:putative ABC transport system ATP-binding protein